MDKGHKLVFLGGRSYHGRFALLPPGGNALAVMPSMGVLLGLSGWSPGMLLSTLGVQYSLPQRRALWPQVSAVLWVMAEVPSLETLCNVPSTWCTGVLCALTLLSLLFP